MSSSRIELFLRRDDALAPASFRRSARPLRHSNITSVELFRGERFTYGGAPRYFGTGVAGYVSGPGFTGGCYGYGAEPVSVSRRLERSGGASEARAATGATAVGFSRLCAARSRSPEPLAPLSGLLDPAA